MAGSFAEQFAALGGPQANLAAAKGLHNLSAIILKKKELKQNDRFLDQKQQALAAQQEEAAMNRAIKSLDLMMTIAQYPGFSPQQRAELLPKITEGMERFFGGPVKISGYQGYEQARRLIKSAQGNADLQNEMLAEFVIKGDPAVVAKWGPILQNEITKERVFPVPEGLRTERGPGGTPTVTEMHGQGRTYRAPEPAPVAVDPSFRLDGGVSPGEGDAPPLSSLAETQTDPLTPEERARPVPSLLNSHVPRSPHEAGAGPTGGGF